MVKILVLGARHSGTSILAAYLGAHPEISMLYEDTDQNYKKLYGTKVVGNKLIVHQQIRSYSKASKFGYLINKIWFSLFGYGPDRPYPTSKLSIEDYFNRGFKLVWIERDERDNASSILRRCHNTTYAQASQYLEKCSDIKHEWIDHFYYIRYSDLLLLPTDTLTGLCDFIGIKFDLSMLKGAKYNWKYTGEKQ